LRDRDLTERARAMRKAMTEAETRMWLQLRAGRFEGIKFRRQKTIQDESHKYIVDFAANDPSLVVELDGDTHANQAEYDAVRTRFLEQRGYAVVRFSNLDVLTNMDGVLIRISEAIAGLRGRSPLPTLSPEGERAK
jgi:very-short-patch-repair endonuclease